MIPYTPKQIQVIKESNRLQPRILISEGAKRAGKTVQNNDLFPAFALQYARKHKKFILLGNTLGTLKRNVIDEMSRRWNFHPRFNDANEFKWMGCTFACFGGGKADDYKKIQGFTAQGAYINEGSLINESAFREVLARCSEDGARIIIDTNPDNPKHFLKTDFIDKSGKKLSNGRTDILSFHFEIWDNAKKNGGFLPDEYVESFVDNLPEGMWKKRDAYGLWVAGEGVVYDMFDDDIHLVNQVPDCQGYWVSVDYGTQNATVFLLMGYDRRTESSYVVDEYYYSGRDKGKQKTDKEYSEDLLQFIRKNGKTIQAIIIDPSAASFKAQIKQDGYGYLLKDAKNAVLDGIKNVMIKFHNEKLFINRSCKEMIKELGIYSWNNKTGIDEPIKEFDHACDCLRYYCQTILPINQSTGMGTKPVGW